MTSPTLGTADLVAMVRRAFEPGPADRGLLVMVDLPDAAVPDHSAWHARRLIAADWAERLASAKGELGFDRVTLALYRNARRGNQDLPERAFVHPGGPLPADADEAHGPEVPFEQLLREHALVLAPTEFSATAPLKVLAKKLGFRAATMPGFAASMLPALRVDWTDVDRRCRVLKERLDAADEARLVFEARGTRHELVLDLRHRTAHASSGLLREPGQAGNLPSGETYIVPYEGERDGDPSRSAGTLPVEMEGELLVYRIERNRVVAIDGVGREAARERAEIDAEPAYANVAELGLGLLRDYGITPTSEILLDEKLGVHIAFGRSDHLGGSVTPAAWRDPERVIHIDRVFIPETMPHVVIRSVDLVAPGKTDPLIRDGSYV